MAVAKKDTVDTMADLKTLAKDAGTEVKAVSTTTEAAVHSAQGGHIRTYSKEVHGENFEELATEFVAHTPGAVITVR